MKLSDDDLKKALQKAAIPEPSAVAKKIALQRAADEFAKTTPLTEKKSKGFLFFLRHMGKSVSRILTINGEPIMTRTAFATIGVAVIVAGVFLTISTNTHFFKAEPDLVIKDKPKQTSQKHFADKRNASGPEKIASPETVAEQTPVLGGEKGQLARELDAALPQEPVQGSALNSKDERLLSAPDQKIFRHYENEGYSQAYKAPAYTPGDAGHATPAPTYAERPATAPARDALSYYYKDEGRDRFTEIKTNPVNLVAEQPVSTFSIDVDTASYSFIRRQLNSGVLPQKDAVRIEEMINYFDYDYRLPADRTKPFAPTVAVYPTPWNPNTKILHVGIKGYDIPATQKPRSNLVFLVDVSGSMKSPDKLPLLKNSLAMLVDTLSSDDSVAIVVYAGAAGTVLEPTRISDKGKILAALDRLQAGGSTAGGAGINLAYSLAEMNFDAEAVNRVILATDGDFNVGITNQTELKNYIERKRKTGIFLSVLGFGQGNYNDSLMQDLAQNGNGTAAYIDTLNEARKVLVDEADSTLFTIARDVKIQVEFNQAFVHDYRLIGYGTRMLNREDFNNDQVDAGEVGAGASVTALYEFTPTSAEEKPVDPLRYQKLPEPAKSDTAKAEYAFVKIRYKLPDSETSALISQPVGHEQEYTKVESVPADLRFAASVAAYGQLLRQDPYTKSYSYDDVISLAEPARGRDPFGLRSEFLNLIRLAKSARNM